MHLNPLGGGVQKEVINLSLQLKERFGLELLKMEYREMRLHLLLGDGQ